MVGEIAKIICFDLESGDKAFVGKIYQDTASTPKAVTLSRGINFLDVSSYSDNAERVISDVKDFYSKNESFYASFLSYINEDMFKDGKRHMYEFYIETKIFSNKSPHSRIENPYLLYFTTSDVELIEDGGAIFFKNLNNIEVKKRKEILSKIEISENDTVNDEQKNLLIGKEEQIKKMTEIIRAKYKEWLGVMGVIPEGTTYYAECLGGSEDCAEQLYEAGYRKVGNDIKVISE